MATPKRKRLRPGDPNYKLSPEYARKQKKQFASAKREAKRAKGYYD